MHSIFLFCIRDVLINAALRRREPINDQESENNIRLNKWVIMVRIESIETFPFKTFKFNGITIEGQSSVLSRHLTSVRIDQW